MYRVNIKDDGFNQMNFEFSSMEEVFIFTETVLKKSVAALEVKIQEIKEEEQ